MISLRSPLTGPLSTVLLSVSLTAQTLTPVEQLGKVLFFDDISQPANSMSCASCHGPAAGWTGPTGGITIHGAVYRGASPTRFGNRKPPTSACSTFAPIFQRDPDRGEFFGGVFWDGRATGQRLGNPAAEQALGPFLNPVEQNMPGIRAICEHVQTAKYALQFVQVWGPGSLDCSPAGVAATYDRIGISIAAYEGSVEVSPFSSKFDAYWRACRAAGNSAEACGLAQLPKVVLDPGSILTLQEFDGLVEFGEYCSSCHLSQTEGPGGRPPLFTDFRFDNIGTPRNPANPFYGMDRVFLDNGQPIDPLGAAYVDRGLGDFLRSVPAWAPFASLNDGKFRVPTLRNVDQRPGNGFPKAFMHNGALKSLEQVVHFYNTRDIVSEHWPPPEVPANLNSELVGGAPVGNLGLDRQAEAAIVAFMKTLNDGWVAPRK